MPHGTTVKTRLVGPWTNTGRVVLVHSHFASVETARVPFQMGGCFTFFVKTAHHGFLLSTLSATPTASGCKCTAMVHRDERSGIHEVAVLSMD